MAEIRNVIYRPMMPKPALKSGVSTAPPVAVNLAETPGATLQMPGGSPPPGDCLGPMIQYVVWFTGASPTLRHIPDPNATGVMKMPFLPMRPRNYSPTPPWPSIPRPGRWSGITSIIPVTTGILTIPMNACCYTPGSNLIRPMLNGSIPIFPGAVKGT